MSVENQGVSTPETPQQSTVVESNIPATPLDASPIEAYIKSQSEPPRNTQTAAAIGEVPPAMPAAPVAPAPVVTPPAADPQLAARLQTASQAYGIDLTGFTDEQSALAYVAEQWTAPSQDIWADEPQYDDSQMLPPAQTQQPPVQVPTPPTQVAAEPPAPSLDPANVDPNIVEWAKAQEAKTAKLEALVQQYETDRLAQREAAVKHADQMIRQRADAAFSAADAEVYGTPGKRTAAQIQAAREVAGLVKQIVQNRMLARQPVPLIEEVARMAVAAHKARRGAVAAPAPQQPAPQGQPFTFPPSSPANAGTGVVRTLPRVSPQNDPFGLFKDPIGRQIFAENLFK